MVGEAFKLNYRTPRLWVVVSNDNSTYIEQVQSKDHGARAEIGVWLRGSKSKDYISFTEARAREKSNSRLLKELSTIESIIKEKGGEIF